MEKYFIIKKQSIIDDWNKYKELSRKEIEIFKIAKNEMGFEASDFFATKDELFIVPTKTDKENFGSMFTKTSYKGNLKKFSANSKVGKQWKQLTKMLEYESPQKPILFWALTGNYLTGRTSQMIFEVDGVVYGSLELDHDFEIGEGQIEEIKASEYYKIIEDHNEKIKNKKE